MKSYTQAVLCMMCGIFYVVSVATAQNCPDFTRFDQGTWDQWPEGWCIFTVIGQNGVWKSDLNVWNPTRIPNTDSESPRIMEISDDGRWIVYNANATTYLINVDGSSKVNVPTRESDPPGAGQSGSNNSTVVGWYRGSPHGTEIFYVPGPFQVYARAITISGNTPVVGESRPILIFEPFHSGIINFWEGASVAVVNDQLIGRIDKDYPDGVHSRPGYVTLPGGGTGVAGWADRYSFSNETDNDSDYIACGMTMSFDGLYCAANSGFVGGADGCVPNQKTVPKNEHKGFYITRFMRKTDTPYTIDGHVLEPDCGVSINWCPEEYRDVTIDYFNFDRWKFGNHNQYVIGSLRGSRIFQVGKHPGLWLIHWPTNTWREITPSTNTDYTDYPAVFFTDLTSVDGPGRTGSGLMWSERPQWFVASGIKQGRFRGAMMTRTGNGLTYDIRGRTVGLGPRLSR